MQSVSMPSAVSSFSTSLLYGEHVRQSQKVRGADTILGGTCITPSSHAWPVPNTVSHDSDVGGGALYESVELSPACVPCH